MNLTKKQRSILDVIQKGDDGDFIDLDQLLDRLSYQTTKQSMQFSIRALTGRRYIEKLPTETRRGRARVRYRITYAGRMALAHHDETIAEAIEDLKVMNLDFEPEEPELDFDDPFAPRR